MSQNKTEPKGEWTDEGGFLSYKFSETFTPEPGQTITLKVPKKFHDTPILKIDSKTGEMNIKAPEESPYVKAFREGKIVQYGVPDSEDLKKRWYTAKTESEVKREEIVYEMLISEAENESEDDYSAVKNEHINEIKMQKEKFSTGSQRDIRDGKGRFDLIPPHFLKELAIHYENGGKKYGDKNWERGQPISRVLDSAMRHINNYRLGMRDEKHLVAAAWNLIAANEYERLIELGKLPKELNDL